MGLFSRKRKIRVPLPPTEDLLRFPKAAPPERIIEPERLKEAVSWEKPLAWEGPSLPKMVMPKPLTIKKPFFLRLSHYQQLLVNLGGMKEKAEQLEQVTENLEKSEFNENADYEDLKNCLKKIHDHLLRLDDLIFLKKR